MKIAVSVLLTACGAEEQRNNDSNAPLADAQSSDVQSTHGDGDHVDVAEASTLDSGDSGVPEASTIDGDAGVPEASITDGPTDADICGLCTDSLAPEVSLECFCRTHSCPSTFAEALADPKWTQVSVGCGYVIISVPWGTVGVGDGHQRIYDMNGVLVGALLASDVTPVPCYTPIGDVERASGGDLEYAVDEIDGTMGQCSEATYCALVRNDAGTLIDEVDGGNWSTSLLGAEPCNEAALLALFPDGG